MECYRHPGTPSAATCVACEQPICEECREEVAGHPMCQPCVAATQARLAEQEAAVVAPAAGPAPPSAVQPPAPVSLSASQSATGTIPLTEQGLPPGAQVMYGRPPGLGRRILRGMLWGILYGQWWTLWQIISMFFWGQGSFDKYVVALVIFFSFVNGVFGSLTGLVIGAANASERTGMIIGVGAGLLLCVLRALLFHNATQLINFVFYYFTGRYVGLGITGRVQKLLPLKGAMPGVPAPPEPAQAP